MINNFNIKNDRVIFMYNRNTELVKAQYQLSLIANHLCVYEYAQPCIECDCCAIPMAVLDK